MNRDFSSRSSEWLRAEIAYQRRKLAVADAPGRIRKLVDDRIASAQSELLKRGEGQ